MCKPNNSTCQTCGKTFKPVKGKANKYCSMNCYRAFQRSGNYKARESKRVHNCATCGKEVRNKHVRKNANGEYCNIYCSKGCYDKARKRLEKKLCEYCGNEFSPKASEQMYCNNTCRKAAEAPAPRTCVTCGSLFSAVKPISGRARWYVRVTNAKTCSQECLSKFYRTNKARKEKISKAFRAEKHPSWQGGSHSGDKRGPGWQRIAERCRDLHNRKCKHCGMTEEESKARGWGRLQVNHITPFHQCRNKQHANRQSNLEALCKSCHTKADWRWRKENPVQQSLNIFR